jgi:hypothetical protein
VIEPIVIYYNAYELASDYFKREETVKEMNVDIE